MSMLLLVSILLPILAGAALFFLKKAPERAVRAAAMAAVCITSALVLALLVSGGSETLSLVRFPNSLSFSLKSDGLGRFFAGMVAFLWPFSMVYTFVYMQHDARRRIYESFYVMTYGVVLGVAFSANALTLYVFYEMLTFITLPLITHTDTREARRAGRSYLYYSLSGSSLALAGIVIMMVTTGTTDFVPGGIPAQSGRLTLFAYALTFLGFGVKAAVFPVCHWLPRASAAPTPTTALLHAVAVVKAGAFAIMRMTFFFFAPDMLAGTWAQGFAVLLAALTVIFGSCMALKEQHFKRRFAYSTISNLSYILLGTLLATGAGLEASLLHFLMHSVTKIGIFFCIGALLETNRAQYVFELNGMGRKAPLAFIFFTLSGLSLIGIPPFCGFVSKYYLLRAAMQTGGLWGYVSVGALIFSAVLTAVYVLQVSFRAFVREPNELSAETCAAAREPEKGFLIVVGVFAVLSLLLGLCGQTVMGPISEIVGGLGL